MKEACRNRNLGIGGNKSDLIARLRPFDELGLDKGICPKPKDAKHGMAMLAEKHSPAKRQKVSCITYAEEVEAMQKRIGVKAAKAEVETEVDETESVDELGPIVDPEHLSEEDVRRILGPTSEVKAAQAKAEVETEVEVDETESEWVDIKG